MGRQTLLEKGAVAASAFCSSIFPLVNHRLTSFNGIHDVRRGEENQARYRVLPRLANTGLKTE